MVPDTKVGIRCICPDPATHPGGDVVELQWPLPFPTMALLNKTVRWEKSSRPAGLSMPAALALLTELYLRHTIASWTLELDGKPIPVADENVEKYLMAAPLEAFEVADRADDLYSEIVLGPLIQRASPSSPAGPTEQSTSPAKANGAASKTSKRSSRSSSSNTETTAIEATA